MKKQTLHDLAKFAAGLVLADFICLWWMSAYNLFPIRFLGAVWTRDIVGPGLIFDAVIFIILVHYGWHIGRTPALRSKTYFGLVGTIFALVAIVHLARIFMNWQFWLGGFIFPVWLSWIGVAVTTYLSYMSFRLAMRMK